MGLSQSKPEEVEIPRKPQNRLSKPRTNTSTYNLLNTNPPPAASRRNSQSVVPLATSDKRHSFVTPEDAVVEAPASSRRGSLGTRQRLREHLFRTKSSDGRSRASSITTGEEVARDAAIARWAHVDATTGKLRIDELMKSSESESRKTSSRPTSRRGSTAYASYSHHASRLSLVAEAHTPEPNMDEAVRRLEQVSERAHTERSNSDASIIPIRRRSILMTPGVATRRDSNGALLYESFPVSRRLSAVGTVESRRSSWYDPSNPGLSTYPEMPATSPSTLLSPAVYDDAPRAVTPCEQVGHLGAYKLGTLRITNGDSHHDEDGPKDLSIEIPLKPLRSEISLQIGESPKNALVLAQEYQQELVSLSPFSFENSRSPSPQLQTTSKNTALEDELFEYEPPSEIVDGSPEHALRILDGSASASSTKPSIGRSQTSPVRVSNSYGSLNNTMQGAKEVPYKPLTKNDSGYSSNVSLRSFKAQAEARAAAAKSCDKPAAEEPSKRKSEPPRPSKDDEEISLALALKTIPVNPTIINAPQLPENSVEQNMGAGQTSQCQVGDTNRPWSFRPSLGSSRKPSNSGSVGTDPSTNSASTKSSVSLLRRLTKGRPATQPVVTVTSDRTVDSQLIPPVSPRVSAKLEQRQKECPTLSHTYKSISRTNSRETLTTILSAAETSEFPSEQQSSLEFGKLTSSAAARNQDDGISSKMRSRSRSRSPSVPEEMMKSQTLQRRASKDKQSQVDFETHITSFGTVSESLGASPYDLAISAMAPRKRSQSFHNQAKDRLSNSNRSFSSNDLAPHNIRAPVPGTRKGMSADTAAQLARQKSRDREVGRQMSAENLRDDRSALPSNRMAMRASMTSNNSPMRSPHAHRRNSSIPKNTKTPPPPVTMSAYRKSLPAESFQQPSPTAMSDRGPVASANSVTYPQPGPWVPQRPQAMHRQSANDVIRPDVESQLSSIRRPQSTRPSLESIRPSLPQFKVQDHSSYHYNNHPSSTFNNSTQRTSTTPPARSHSRPPVAPEVLDRYSGGLAHGYDAGYGLGGSAGTRNTWTIGKNGRNMEAGPALQYGVDFGDVPVMLPRVRQEA